MTSPLETPSSQEEWQSLLVKTEEEVKSAPPKTYKAPEIGSAAFAKTIDHTLLKLDANEVGIDRLCEEARRFGFKVGHICVISDD